MTQYIDKSALEAEIESKIKKYYKRGEESDALQDGYGMYWGGVLSCLNEVKTLIDTLEVKEEPVSKNLEEAAEKYTWDDYGDIEEGERVNGYIIDHVKTAFKAGAQWKEQQMMKGLCYKTEVYRDSDGDGIETPYSEWLTLENDEIDVLPDIGLKEGDKVKVIIIKDE